MTNAELDTISNEIDDISKQLNILDSDNAIESTLREHLLHRWDFLDHQLECALIAAKRNKLHIVSCDNNNL